MDITTSDLTRRIENVVGLGTISQVDHASFRVRVDINGRETGWLPVPGQIGANFRQWRPLREGTQVLLACPSGDVANAIIVQILYSNSLPPPSTDGKTDLVQWDDGTLVTYDANTKTMVLFSAGDLTIQCEGTLRLLAGADIRIDTPADIRMLEGP
jgi:phage baseplate assembly protein V